MTDRSHDGGNTRIGWLVTLQLPPLVTLWIGERLTPVERACLSSVVRQGHHLTLYSYEPLADVPPGIEVADAATVVPREAIVRHSGGSVSLFSNRFRFELQRHGAGIWIDTDVYLLAPLRYSPNQYVFGWQPHDTLGSGILQVPYDSPIIEPILRLFERPYVPSWIRRRDQLRARARQLRHRHVDLGRMPWGVAGPLALTHLARRHQLLHYAEPSDVFYPWHYGDAAWIFDPDDSLANHTTPRTTALHLYNYMIASRKEQPAPHGSFIDRLHQEGATC